MLRHLISRQNLFDLDWITESGGDTGSFFFSSFLNKNEDQSLTQIKVLRRRSRPSPTAAGSFQGRLAAEDPVLFTSCCPAPGE